MKHTKIETVLLVQRIADGLFWAPHEDAHTTSPGWTDNATGAKVYHAWEHLGIAEALKHSPDYFNENSPRMRGWLAGSHMVKAQIVTTVEIL